MTPDDELIYNAIIGSTVYSDAAINELRKSKDILGYMAVQIHKMRLALRKHGFNWAQLVTMSDISAAIEQIKGIDNKMKASGFTDEFATLYKETINASTVIPDDAVYCQEFAYNNDMSNIMYAPKRDVVEGSCLRCFRDCTHLTSISSEIPWHKATSLQHVFWGTAMLPAEHTIDCANATNISYMGGNFSTLHLKNTNKAINFDQIQAAGSIYLKKITGLDFSAIQPRNRSHGTLLNLPNLETIEFAGLQYNSDGTITDRREELGINNRYFSTAQWVYSGVQQSTYPYILGTPATKVNAQSLLGICMLMYDWNNNPEGVTKTGDVRDHYVSGFTSQQKALLNEAYGEEYITNLITAKGWTY